MDSCKNRDSITWLNCWIEDSNIEKKRIFFAEE